MIRVKKSEERGHVNHGWLDTYHSFSFASYWDPGNMGFRDLRVINEDVVEAGRGFGSHPHNDMEIVTWIVDGALRHRDSMDNGSVIKPGRIQRMTAGTGVIHSEFNASKTEPVHLLQIWILPDTRGLTPGYEERDIDEIEGNGFRLIGSRDGRDGSITIHQDVSLYAARLEPGKIATHSFAAGRHGWLQIVRGAASINGTDLDAGDGVAISEEREILVVGRERYSEMILFDLN